MYEVFHWQISFKSFKFQKIKKRRKRRNSRTMKNYIYIKQRKQIKFYEGRMSKNLFEIKIDFVLFMKGSVGFVKIL